VLNPSFSGTRAEPPDRGPKQNSKFGPATPPRCAVWRSKQQHGLVQGTLPRLRFSVAAHNPDGNCNTAWRANRVRF